MIDVKKTGARCFMWCKINFGSIKRASEYIGVSTVAVYKWKSEGRVPTIDNLVLIADYIGCKVDDLIVRCE